MLLPFNSIHHMINYSSWAELPVKVLKIVLERSILLKHIAAVMLFYKSFQDPALVSSELLRCIV